MWRQIIASNNRKRVNLVLNSPLLTSKTTLLRVDVLDTQLCTTYEIKAACGKLQSSGRRSLKVLSRLSARLRFFEYVNPNNCAKILGIVVDVVWNMD